MYWQGKWTASKLDASSGCYAERGGSAETTNTGCGGGCNSNNGRDGARGCDGNSGGNRWSKLTCHNCGKQGHISRNCFLPGGGAYNTQSGGGGAEDNGSFLGVDERTLRRSPQGKEPRICTLLDGTSVKWCSPCGSWGNYFRAGHTAEDDAPIVETTDNVPAEGNVVEPSVPSDNDIGAAVGTFAGSPAENVAIADQCGAMARLRQAGLI